MHRLATRFLTPFAALFAGLAALPAGAACEARSGAQTAAFIELYTSEGCDSCPPADRWLSALDTAGSGVPLVALAFHVDYWDQLGWRDAYASGRYSQRQRERVAAGGGHVVYTPQVMLNGRDFRRWNEPVWFNVAQAVTRRPAGVQLGLTLARDADGRWRARLDATLNRPVPAARAWLAVYENELWSQVTAGENRGKRLRHDRVVRRLDGPATPDANGRLQLAAHLAPDPHGERQGGIAAFVEDAASGELLQALALPFCPDEAGKSGG